MSICLIQSSQPGPHPPLDNGQSEELDSKVNAYWELPANPPSSVLGVASKVYSTQKHST